MTAERGSNEDKQQPRVKCKEVSVKKDTRSMPPRPEADHVSDAVLYRAILDGAYDWEFFVRPDGVYLYVSPSCERISGYTSEDFLSDPALMDRIVHPDDRERWVEHEESLHTCETPMEIDFRILRRDGQVVWIGHVCHRVVDGTEVYIGRRGSNRDITAHKRAEEALRESEERYRLIFEGSKEGIIFIGADNRRDILNNRLAEMCGYTVEELLGTSALTMIHPDDFERVRENNRKRLAGELPSSTYEFRVIHKDGHSIDVEGTFNSINRDGKVIGVCGILRDIGARKRVEESLREREELYRQMFDSHASIKLLIEPDTGAIVDANAAACDFYGYSREQLKALHITDINALPPGKVADAMTSTKHGASTHFEFPHRLASGELRDVEVYTGPLDVRGRRLLFSIIHDITDRKRAEAELEHIYANARCLLWHADVELRNGEEQWSIRVVNEEAAQRYLPLKLKPGQSYFDALMDNREEFHDEARKLDRNAKRAFQEGASRLQHEFPCRRSDGEIRWIYEDAYIQPAGAGQWRVVGVSTDITDRRKAEGDLKQTLSLLAATLESTTDGILVVDASGRETSFNKKFVEMWRIPAELAATRDDATIMGFAIAQLADPEGFHAKVVELYASPDRESFDVLEFKDGRVFERYSLPQRLEGRSVGRVWSFRDVTERKRAEEEREKLEAQILHAQKLESLGILAGGIAHDFNNILTSILGNAELAMLEVPQTTPAHANLRNIELSARRAAELTRQMLAYSGKGRFLIQQIRIPDEVREMIPLLGVSISKKCTLTCRFAENVPVVVGDASQIRQVIMNLIVNASEAIGDNVGEITISAGITACDRSYLSETYIDDHLPQGEYVFLEVSDTGCGISPEVRAKLFDPFFTTKFTGRGLGLAAVMGVVRGHQGAIRVTSEPGHGATFRVLFPAADSGAVIAEDRSRVESGLRGCGGTVLVVDDETAVRDLASAILERAGYQVMTAADGRQAVELFQGHADEINVVLLDMTMPHMSGGEAFREIRRIRGDCRIVLSSGYTEVDARSRFGENELAGFIQKPFRMADLLEAVQKALSPI